MIAHVTNAVADPDVQIRDKGKGGGGGGLRSGHSDPEIRGGGSNKFDNTPMLSKRFSKPVLSSYIQHNKRLLLRATARHFLRVGPQEKVLFLTI